MPPGRQDARPEPKEGTCASVGYTVPDGTYTMKIPVIGKEQTFDLFTKAMLRGAW